MAKLISIQKIVCEMVDNVLCDHCSTPILDTEIYNDGIKRVFWCQPCIAIDGWRIEALINKLHPSTEPFKFVRTFKGCDGVEKEYRYHFFCSGEYIKILSVIPKFYGIGLKDYKDQQSQTAKWGVFTAGNKLVSAPDGVSPAKAKEMAERWNKVTNTDWYTAKEMQPIRPLPTTTKPIPKEVEEHFNRRKSVVNQKPEHNRRSAVVDSKVLQQNLKELKLIAALEDDIPANDIGSPKAAPDKLHPKGCGCIGDCIKNITVSLYMGKEVRGFLTPGHRWAGTQYRDMANFLDKHLPVKLANEIIFSLQEQQKDPNKFPNVVMFLDEDGSVMPIGDYMKKIWT